MSDPGGSELRPRPALTALWSLGALQVLPRFPGGREVMSLEIPFWKEENDNLKE